MAKNTYYGIKTPEGLIFWMDQDEHRAWARFFNENPWTTTMYTSIKAFEAIGYRCVEFTIDKIKEVPTTVEKEKVSYEEN